MAKTKPTPISKKRAREKAVAYTVMDEILDRIDLAAWALTRPANFRYECLQGGLTLQEWQKINEDRKRRRAIADLRRKRWLTARKHGNQMIIRLDHDALAACLKAGIRSEKRELPAGQSCLVIFDFPTGANSARASWRRFLISIGCTRTQLSVWKTEKDVCKEIAALTRLLAISRWVQVFQAANIRPGGEARYAHAPEPKVSHMGHFTFSVPSREIKPV